MALLSIEHLSKSFTLHRVGKRIQGCDDVSLAIEPGEFVGITGRSGSGKSTILRCIWRTNLPEGGRILYDSERFGLIDLCCATQRQMLYLRAYELGYVSQFLSALPRQTAYEIVLKSALEAFGAEERVRAEVETERMLRHFDLDEELWELYPRTFSGGEKLRLNIAAAMIKRRDCCCSTNPPPRSTTLPRSRCASSSSSSRTRAPRCWASSTILRSWKGFATMSSTCNRGCWLEP